MIITFFTKDGQYTTDRFETTREAKKYLAETITPIMIEDIQSMGQNRAAIFIPNAEVSLHAHRGIVRYHQTKNKKSIYDDLKKKNLENANSENFSKDAIQELLKIMTTTPDNIESKEHRKNEEFNKRYRYFIDNIEILYNDPNWKECKKRYDDEFKR